jgi:hypothetical protein
MRTTSQAKRDLQLGESTGAAVNRLKRRVMFSLLVRLGENVCLRCGNEMSVDDFTLDHVQPWLDEDVALFWDLTNIAFSHFRCNVSAARKPTKKYASVAEGHAARCRQMLREPGPNATRNAWRRAQYASGVNPNRAKRPKRNDLTSRGIVIPAVEPR